MRQVALVPCLLLYVMALAVSPPATVRAATFITTRFDDPTPNGCLAGDCSLREAIITANALAGPDTIQLGAGIYQLTRSGAGEDQASSGDLDLRDSVALVGAGAAQTTVLMTQQYDRVFHILAATSPTVVMSGLSIQGGALLPFSSGPCEETCAGGGIYVAPSTTTLTLNGVDVRNNTASIGGGIWASFNSATSTLSNVTIDGNSATRGGGLYWFDGGPLTQVRISNNSATSVDGGATLIAGNTFDPNAARSHGLLTIENNTAFDCAGASLYSLYSAYISLAGSTVRNNHADDNGGGLCVSTHATPVALYGMTLQGNTAYKGGAIKMLTRIGPGADGLRAPKLQTSGLAFIGNHAVLAGGAIHDDTSDCGIPGPCASLLILRNAVFDGNEALGTGGSTSGKGGAIYYRGEMILLDGIVENSRTDGDGGAIYLFGDPAYPIDRRLLIRRTTINHNEAGNGGGIYVTDDARVSIFQSLIVNNTAAVQGGGVFARSSEIMRISNTTLTGNAAGANGGGINATLGARVELQHVSIVRPGGPAFSGSALNASGAGTHIEVTSSLLVGSCSGASAISATSGNVESTGSTCNLPLGQPVNVSAATLNLGALMDNGGPSLSHLPGAASIAIGQVGSADCFAFDQRGFVRGGGACDSGAIETGGIDDVLFRDGFNY